MTTTRAYSPWVQRARAGALPPSDRTATIATDRDVLTALGAPRLPDRIAISGRSYTIADLQRAIARDASLGGRENAED